MKDFKLIVYSSEKDIKDEIFYLNDLLAKGLSQLHLRKPRTPKFVLENLILNIDPRQHSKIVIHSHYDLLDKYKLQGIHFTSKYLEKAHPLNIQTIIKTARIKNYTLSRPVHSLEELSRVEDYYDFVTLSPVFDSISKKDYYGKAEEFARLNDYKKPGLSVYGLGGISKDNIVQAQEMGFDGVVLMGAIWGCEEPEYQYDKILKMVDQVG